MDECYIGGKPRKKGDSKTGRGTKKQAVVALVQREGRVVAGPVERVSTQLVRSAIKEFVDSKSTICTDDLNVYRHLPMHYAVNHTMGEYVRREPDGF